MGGMGGCLLVGQTAGTSRQPRSSSTSSSRGSALPALFAPVDVLAAEVVPPPGVLQPSSAMAPARRPVRALPSTGGGGLASAARLRVVALVVRTRGL